MAGILLPIQNKMSAQKWNQKVQFPRDNYVVRVTDESFGPSKSSGNPMITLEFEVVSPEEVQVGTGTYTVVGVGNIRRYYPTIVYADAEGTVDTEKTANAQERVRELYRLFGMDDKAINFENPELAFKGKKVYALLYADEVEQRKAPTAEELKQGKKQGEILKNPITGKALISYYPKIDEVFGIAPDDASKPY